ncbi:uncharacterized protein LOC121876888 [Homarus americanus]|uniref:uncharacterized protein LOC121876888 n=1 Tax=Homarus americanus TaxID=6706 RepID=UPI001C4623E6|nr:uncharacterized protein LOC121876888 [Homarus americanus]
MSGGSRKNTSAEQYCVSEDQRRVKVRRSQEARKRAKKYEEDLRQAIINNTAQVEKLRAEKAKFSHKINRLEDLLYCQGESHLVTDAPAASWTNSQEQSPYGSSSSSMFEMLSDLSLQDESLSTASLVVPDGHSGQCHGLPDTTAEGNWWGLPSDSSSSSSFPNFSWETTSFETSAPHPSFSDTSYSWNSVQDPSLQDSESTLFPNQSVMTLGQTVPPSGGPHAFPTPGPSTYLPQSSEGGDAAHTAEARKTSSSRRQKNRVYSYQLPPQQDPQLEARRLKAVRAHHSRQQDKCCKQQLQEEIQRVTDEVTKLNQEKERIQEHIDTLQRQYKQLPTTSDTYSEFY